MKNHVCIVCEYGWIISGIIDEELPDAVKLTDSAVVRRWDNGRGIGGIAKEVTRGEYTLDAIGDVEIKQSKILFTIPCEW